MANFTGTKLTQRGRNILAKAIAGAPLKITKITLGDGVWDENINPEELTDLVSPKISLPIQEITPKGDGTTQIRVLLTNSGLKEGFFTRELGIYAEDPDSGEEILYAVDYASNPDYIPSGDGPTKIEDVFDIYVVTANAQNVTAVISDTVILASKQDIEEHNQSFDAHPDIRQEIDGIKNGGITVGNADKVDGKDASDFASIDLSNITNLGKILELDGKGSGLDADFVRGLPADFTANLNENGYTRLPNGLIIQWGQVSFDYQANTNSFKWSAPFPIAFPNKCLQVIAGPGCFADDNPTVTAEGWDNEHVAGYFHSGNSQNYCIRFIAIGY